MRSRSPAAHTTTHHKEDALLKMTKEIKKIASHNFHASMSGGTCGRVEERCGRGKV